MKIKNYYSYFETRGLEGHRNRRLRNVDATMSDLVAKNFADDGPPIERSPFAWRLARVLEGRDHESLDEGVHAVNYMRSLRRNGTPGPGAVPESSSPEDWNDDIYELAANARIHDYFRIHNATEASEFIRRTRPQGGLFGAEVRATVQLNSAWDDPPAGEIPPLDSDLPILGTHSILIAVFSPDDCPDMFCFRNMWGDNWGDSGAAYLTRETYNQYVLAAWHLEGLGLAPPIALPVAKATCLLWKVDHFGEPSYGVHGREIVGEHGDRIAWTFARVREGYLDIEEFFVWPTERGKGYGRRLSEMLIELSQESQKPLRAWVPYADAEADNRDNLAAAMRLLGLHVRNSPYRSASYLGLAEQPLIAPSNPFLPERPASKRDRLKLGRVRQSATGDHEHEASASKADEPRVYRVWYATNRAPIESPERRQRFGPDRDTTVHYGEVEVAIPKSHRFGSIGSTWLQRWLRGDDRLAIVTSRQRSRRIFWNRLVQDLRRNPGDCVAYIHGYNVDFDEAAIRAAQIGFDLKVQGVTGFFSWPSLGTIRGYLAACPLVDDLAKTTAVGLVPLSCTTTSGRMAR